MNGNEVSHAAMNFIKFSEYFYLRICQLVDVMINRVSKIPEEDAFLNTLKVASSITTGLFLYSVGIKFGVDHSMLPQTSAVYETCQRLKGSFCERLESSKKTDLSIVRLVNECMETVPDTSVWRNQRAQQWYPPQEYTVWLGLFLMVNLSKTAKATLFGYYLHDLSKSGLVADTVSFLFIVEI